MHSGLNAKGQKPNKTAVWFHRGVESLRGSNNLDAGFQGNGLGIVKVKKPNLRPYPQQDIFDDEVVARFPPINFIELQMMVDTPFSAVVTGNFRPSWFVIIRTFAFQMLEPG